MYLRLGEFVQEEKIKLIAEKMLDSNTDIEVINLLKEKISFGELEKLKVLIMCQKQDVGNNFSVLAIYISAIALALPAIEKLLVPWLYISLSVSLAVGLIWGIVKEVLPMINNANERNSKVYYLLSLIDDELNKRSKNG